MLKKIVSLIICVNIFALAVCGYYIYKLNKKVNHLTENIKENKTALEDELSILSEEVIKINKQIVNTNNYYPNLFTTEENKKLQNQIDSVRYDFDR